MNVVTPLIAAALLCASWLWMPTSVHAETPAANANVKVATPYRKVQVFDMTGMDIKGGLTAPMLTDINARTRRIGKSLIKVRIDWKRKIKDAVHSL